MNYHNAKWRRKREHILKLDGYMDVIEKRYGRATEATTVHHIYPAKEYPEYRFEDWNLISVSQKTHNMLENRQTGMLTEKGRQLMERTVPGEDWRHVKNPAPFATRDRSQRGPVGGDFSNSDQFFVKRGKVRGRIFYNKSEKNNIKKGKK